LLIFIEELRKAILFFIDFFDSKTFLPENASFLCFTARRFVDQNPVRAGLVLA